MYSFEVSLGYESVDRSTFSMKRGSEALHVENVVRSTLSNKFWVAAACSKAATEPRVPGEVEVITSKVLCPPS
jgi:hypothetical protein